MADSGYAELQDMRIKFRRYTGWLSTKQISNADVDKYLNNFGLNKLTQYISSSVFEKTLTFYTVPDQREYETSSTATDNLYNFKNIVRVIGAPVYVAGRTIRLYSSISEFFGIYNQDYVEKEITTGNGVLTNFTGTLDVSPILANHVYATSIDTAGDRLLATDDGSGAWEGSVSVPGSINYSTGAYDITFDVAPKDTESIYITAQQYKKGTPDSVLFYNNKLIFGPVPDKTYRVDLITIQRPTKLVNNTDLAPLTEFVDFWVVGSAIDALQERGDIEKATRLSPVFVKEKGIVLSRRVKENSVKGVRTIYNSSGSNSSRYW